MQHASNAIGDVQSRTTRRKPCIGPEEFHHKALVRTALKPNPAIGVQVRHIDFRLHDMHNVCVVPDTLSCQSLAANDHAIPAVPLKHVVSNQWSLIITVAQLSIR